MYIRRGSSHDIRERSPDHGTMGRKQRFVLNYIVTACQSRISGQTTVQHHNFVKMRIEKR